MESNGKKVLLIGLPDAGKSTFIAALWGVVNSEEIPESLKLVSYSGDATYLNKLYDHWVKAEKLPRTLTTNEGLGILELSKGKDKSANFGKIILPDLAGERFSSQWEDRRISKEHYDHLCEVNNILFFIHSKKIDLGYINNSTVNAIDDVFAEVSSSQFSNVNKISEETIALAEEPFSPKHVPTQTKLVDLIQTTLLNGKSIKKIAVIISAWDLVSEEGLIPLEWLSKKMPLLTQYLKTNTERFEYQIWGISAQGGDVEKKDGDSRHKLLTFVCPEKRIIVTDGKIKNSDITSPIKWLFSGDS